MSKFVMNKLTMTLLTIAIAIVLGIHIGCSKIEEDVEDEDVVRVDRIALSTSNAFVKSDGSDSVTITAIALDSNNGLIPDAIIQLTSTGGALGASTLVTGEDGTAETNFSAGVDPANQTVTISGSASGADEYTIPIQIVGTELTVLADPSLEIGSKNATDDMTVTVLDAGDNPIYDATVNFTLQSASTGSVTLSSATATTDVNGEATITVTAASIGDAIVQASSMGATISHTYSVIGTGSGITITDPTANPTSLAIGVSDTITVSAPGVSRVRFATTLGTFTNGEATMLVDVSADTAATTFLSSFAGVATIEVYAVKSGTVDTIDPANKDTLSVAISAVLDSNAQIDLQSSSSNVALSVGNIENSVTLTATVKNDEDEPVGNAAVAFSISNNPGGGEFVSPVLALTNAQGVATSVFTSGTLSSGGGAQGGVLITATIIDTGANDSIPVVIGGTAGSIVIGRGTAIYSIYGDTTYELPMVVMVTDSNGNPVSGATVSLSVWPKYYHLGGWSTPVDKESVPDYDVFNIPNEDVNRNTILDAGEDAAPNLDGLITPPNSAAGGVPTSVTTDEFGAGTFNLVYPKDSAAWITDEIVGSTMVLGSETRSTLEMTLPYMIGDQPSLSASPYY